MKKLLLLLIISTKSIYAHIGETKEQCDIRYGKPHKTDQSGSVLYNKGQFWISIDFYQNKPASIAISKWQNGNKMIDIPISDIKTILTSNANGVQWVKTTNHPMTKGMNAEMWKTIDNSINAIYYIDRRTLEIIDTDNLTAFLANKKPTKTPISNDAYSL